MIAILQFDAASRTHLDRLLAEGYLPALAALRNRGAWYDLDTPATHFEGAAAYSLYSGIGLGEHGLYYPWLWSAAEQRVRFFDDFPAPEAVWERIGRAGLRSLIIDPYEIRSPQVMRGVFLSGWQFRNRVVLRTRSIPGAMQRRLEREFGHPPQGEEVYGRPAGPQLVRLRESLLAASSRGADVVETLLRGESFDLLWISLSATHLAGHRFFDVSQLSENIELARYNNLATALQDIYRSVDQALSRLIAALPAGTDVMVVSPSGMGPNTSRSHLLPGMLEAVLSDNAAHGSKRAPTGSSLWRIRSIVPTNLRAWIARALPDLWALELAARLELRDVNWANTKGFMMPNDDAGYIRLNLRGRERDGIVEPVDADALLDRIAAGLQTFRDIDGRPVIQKIFRTRDLGFDGAYTTRLPDLIVQWSDRVVAPLAGVTSSRFGEIAAPGWGTGRTGCHTADAWALVVPASSELCAPVRQPHIVDIVPTVCAALGLDHDGLGGQSLLQLRTANNAAEKQSNLETRLNRKSGKNQSPEFCLISKGLCED
jgi:predicted AlkP superfamily phosphohydrolase/phosphomutase